MRIATWNVNSVKARLPNVIGWLGAAKPDICVLQEIKCQDPDFPRLEFEGLGYHVFTHGQKSYNGVAFLSTFHESDWQELYEMGVRVSGSRDAAFAAKIRQHAGRTMPI